MGSRLSLQDHKAAYQMLHAEVILDAYFLNCLRSMGNACSTPDIMDDWIEEELQAVGEVGTRIGLYLIVFTYPEAPDSTVLCKVSLG